MRRHSLKAGAVANARSWRFWNRDIHENLDGVFRALEAALDNPPSPLVGEGGPKDRMRGYVPSSSDPSPHPSPTRGEGDLVNPPVGVR